MRPEKAAVVFRQGVAIFTGGRENSVPILCGGEGNARTGLGVEQVLVEERFAHRLLAGLLWGLLDSTLRAGCLLGITGDRCAAYLRPVLVGAGRAFRPARR